jgi:hypothetical protein
MGDILFNITVTTGNCRGQGEATSCTNSERVGVSINNMYTIENSRCGNIGGGNNGILIKRLVEHPF